jgi:dipeptidyl aminopeptidase/acylaminoacyl peptidase
MKADDPKAEEIQLSEDGEKWYSFARDGGEDKKDERVPCIAQWFEDSQKVYALRSDRREVEDLFLVHSLSQPRPTLQTYKYSMPGEKNLAKPELLVFDISNKQRVKIDTDKWTGQAVGLGRSQGIYTTKKSDRVWFIRRDRTWEKIELCVSDTSTGETTVLLSEESQPYFHYRYAQCHLVNDGNEFIWWSERDNWGHFYLYDGDGNLKNRITKGNYQANRVMKVDEKKRVMYFLGYGREKDRDPYYQFYYRISLDGSRLTLLTPEDATHSWDMSEDMLYAVDTYTRVDLVPTSVLRNSSGNVVMRLETMDTSRLEEQGWLPPEMFKVKAADDVTDLYGVMWKPFDFDPDKQYPVIVYCYPGPQSEPVPKTYLLLRNERVHNVPLAQLGFIVISVGQRGGSPQRSKWYHTYGYGNARDYPLADNKYAVEQLARRHSFIDVDRVGIYGRSGGGFMSAAAMLTYPDFYKAAFSSCGNHDNLIYNHSWGELHYGVKEVEKVIKTEEGEKAETFWEPDITTNPEIAENLKGKLMLIHGEIDDNVHPANTFRLANALIKAGKRFDMMIFPGKKHAFGDYTRYIERMMWYFFAEHLKGDYRKNTEIYE